MKQSFEASRSDNPAFIDRFMVGNENDRRPCLPDAPEAAERHRAPGPHEVASALGPGAPAAGGLDDVRARRAGRPVLE